MATKRARIDKLLVLQGERLGRLEDRQAKLVLRAYNDSRRDLLERLQAVAPGDQTATTQALRVMLAQTEAGIDQMQRRLGEVLSAQEILAHERALMDLLAVIRRAEPSFRDLGGAIEVEVVRDLAEVRGLALHRFSVQRYGAELVANIQRQLVVGVTSGDTIDQLAKRVAGTSSFFARNKHRAELIARMELSRSYNGGHLEGLKAAEGPLSRPGDPLLKQIDEARDRRNHPFSRVAHGATAPVGGLFKVSVAKVQAAGRRLGKGAGGVLWKRRGANYVGQNLPAHFNERGRIVPFKASWSL